MPTNKPLSGSRDFSCKVVGQVFTTVWTLFLEAKFPLWLALDISLFLLPTWIPGEILILWGPLIEYAESWRHECLHLDYPPRTVTLEYVLCMLKGLGFILSTAYMYVSMCAYTKTHKTLYLIISGLIGSHIHYFFSLFCYCQLEKQCNSEFQKVNKDTGWEPLLYPNTIGNHRNDSQETAPDRSRENWEVGRDCYFPGGWTCNVWSRKLQTAFVYHVGNSGGCWHAQRNKINSRNVQSRYPRSALGFHEMPYIPVTSDGLDNFYAFCWSHTCEVTIALPRYLQHGFTVLEKTQISRCSNPFCKKKHRLHRTSTYYLSTLNPIAM